MYVLSSLLDLFHGTSWLMQCQMVTQHFRMKLVDKLASQLEEMKQPIDDDLALILLIRSRLTVLSPHSKARWQTLKRMAT